MANPLPAVPALPARPATHDVAIVSTRKLAQARVMGVPPEQFGIEHATDTDQTSSICPGRNPIRFGEASYSR
jgi:hypothetical protein